MYVCMYLFVYQYLYINTSLLKFVPSKELSFEFIYYNILQI